MGTSYNGGMIVGARWSDIECLIDGHPDEPIEEWIEAREMVIIKPHKNATLEESFMGFPVPDVCVWDINESWIKDNIRDKAFLFREYTYQNAYLIGTQDIT